MFALSKRKQMKKLITILFILIQTIGFSQTTISGKVLDKKNNPIPGVNIFIENSYDGTSSNMDGIFSFKTSEKGKQTILLTYLGYQTIKKKIILNGKELQFTFELKEKFNELKAVTISAGAFEASDKKKAVILSSLDMITTPGSNGDVTGALKTLPGTTPVGESGKLFVRGGSSGETKTFIDGTLVQSPYAKSPPNTSVRGKFNPFMFSGTIFSTGGYSAEYGQAMSSVLLLNTKEIPEEDQLNLSIMTVGLEVGGTKKWKTGAITATFGHTNLLPYMKIAPQNTDWTKYPFFNRGDVSIRQKTKKTGMLKFYGSFSNSKFELNRKDVNNNNKLTSYNLTNQNFYINTSWKGVLSEKWMMKSGVSFTNDLDNIGIEKDKFTQKFNAGHLKTVFTHLTSKKIKLKIGAEIQANDYTREYQTDSTTLSSNYKGNIFAGFIESNIHLNSNFIIRIGGRVEKDDYLKKTNISPRLSSAVKLGSNTQLSLAYGWFYQNPDNQHLIYTNKLNFEQAEQFILSFQTKKHNRTLKIEPYYKKYNDLVKFTNNAFYTSDYYTNDGKGFSYGIDLFFRDKKTIKNGDYWISYSYLEAKREYENYPEEATPRFASKHNFSVVYRHWIGKWRSLVGVTYSYASPRNYHNPNLSGFNNSKTKAYQSLNVNWSYLYRENIIFHAAVNNVLGYKNHFGNTYSSTPNSNGEYTSNEIIPGATRFYLIGCFITFSKDKTKNQLDKIN